MERLSIGQRLNLVLQVVREEQLLAEEFSANDAAAHLNAARDRYA